MAQIDWTRILSPAEIIGVSARLPEAAFVRIFGHTPLLAIAVPSGDAALEAGLKLAVGNFADPGPSGLGRLAFHTAVAERPVGASSLADRAALIDLRALSERLGKTPRHLVRLEKRVNANSAYADRVSVGRALSGDIILRHRSISKFHAYFQQPEGGSWSLVDAGSTNGTTVNGKVVVPRQQQAVAVGDQVAFGSVDAIFLDAASLWRVLHIQVQS